MLKFFIHFQILLFFFLSNNCFSQDTIIKRDNEIIVAKIIEVDSKSVKYKKNNYLDGPLFILEKYKIRKIIYKNGETEEISSDSEYNNEVLKPVVKSSSSHLTLPANGCKFSLYKTSYDKFLLVIELFNEDVSAFNSSDGELSFYFENSRKNYTIRASMTSNKLVHVIYRLNSPGSYKRLEKIRDYQINRITLRIGSYVFSINVDKDTSNKINKMVSQIFPADNFEEF